MATMPRYHSSVVLGLSVPNEVPGQGGRSYRAVDGLDTVREDRWEHPFSSLSASRRGVASKVVHAVEVARFEDVE